MDPERWNRLESLYHSALNRPAPERDAYLSEVCADDAALREEVRTLIAKHEQSGNFIDSTVFDIGIRAMAEEEAMFGPGKMIGHYLILDVIGRGGMGEVYLARDPRLGRKVALKLLPRALKGDAERVWRFRQEARAASAVSHPNIAHVYDVGEAEGLFYTAIEYVEGVTLRQRITEGKLNLREALYVALQIAEALAAAHAAGVVHRDVKPENVMVRHDGYVKVLDFGLAKLVERLKTSMPGEQRAPAATLVHSEPGVVMGTVSYMSPEQARGKPVDARTDVWSLGVVLYELLTGRRPFEGESAGDIMVSILEREPEPLARLRSDIPTDIERVVTKALAKDPASRYQSAGDMASELRRVSQRLGPHGDARASSAYAGQGPLATSLMETDGQPEARSPEQGYAAHTASAERVRRTVGMRHVVSRLRQHKRGALLFGAAFILMAGSVLYTLYRLSSRTGAGALRARPERSMTKLTTSGRARHAAISPDGKYVVYAANGDAGQSLWLRQAGTTRDVQIDAHGDYGKLTFSPDGTRLYYTNFFGDLYQMPILGGVKNKITAGVDSPVTFSPDGSRLAFVRQNHPAKGESSLIVANSDGSEERVLAARKKRDRFASARPAWSPDGKSIACAASSNDSHVAYVNVIEVRLEDGTERTISPQRWFEVGAVAWLAGGDGLVVLASEQEGILSPQIWQLSYPSGEVRRISNDFNAYGDLSLTADSDVLVTVLEGEFHNVWVLPEGKTAGARQITRAAGTYVDLRWTPDGKLVFASNASGGWEIWTLEQNGDVRKQLTVTSGANGTPMFTPDGRYIVFTSLRAGTANIWRMDADGGNPKQLTSGDWEENVVCSPDGQWVVYESGRFGEMGLWKVSLEGGAPVRLTEGASSLPAISPDGKQIAFSYKDSRADSRERVAVIPFGGGQPVRYFDIPVPFPWRGVKWAPDGRALIFIDTRGGVSNLWSQPIGGGPAKQLTDFKAEEIFYFDWSRNGEHLAFVRGSQFGDVVMISSFR